jgi:hypothetical protein
MEAHCDCYLAAGWPGLGLLSGPELSVSQACGIFPPSEK